MNARIGLVALASCLFTIVACGSTADDDAGTSKAATTFDGFVGCRPSAGECYNSCPDHRYRFIAPDARCMPDDPHERGACVCGDAPAPPPDPPEGTFVGCRPSAGECTNSCPTRQGTYVPNWPACPEAGDPLGMDGGCFCR